VKFISLFSGIGGLDLGLEWAGWECVAQVEKDDYCQKVLTKHWPSVPKFKDIYDVTASDLPSADAIVGGFPCQPFSVAGKRKGAADDRYLWPEFMRLIAEKKPRLVVIENVSGLKDSQLDSILSALGSEGYLGEVFILPARAFGAYHERYRLFIVAYTKRQGRQKLVRSELEKHRETSDRKTTITLDSQGNPFLRFQKSVGKPAIFRVDNGIPNRVDRLRGLGNAVVPQVAYYVGVCINEWMAR